MDKNEYAVYKGDDLLVKGTIKECANYMNVKESTIYWYSNPVARKRDRSGKRIIVERVGDYDE